MASSNLLLIDAAYVMRAFLKYIPLFGIII